MDKWYEIWKLKEQGVSIRKISKKLNCHRDTVRKYLQNHDPPEYKSSKRTREIEKHRSLIEKCLENDFIGTRIYRELLKEGYNQEISCLYRFIRELKGEQNRKQVTTRFETTPGQQAQYDWCEYWVEVDGEKKKLYFHQLVLGKSRRKYFCFSTNVKQVSIFQAIEEGFRFFGGTTKELVIDNPKSMVLKPEKNGVIEFNDEFLKFCRHYELEIDPCQVRRARTKGKVERPFSYLQEQLLKGLKVESYEELTQLLLAFTEDYNQKPHSTLKQKPDDLFWEEIPELRELPTPYQFPFEIRKVRFDGYVHYGGFVHVLPMEYSGKEVWVKSRFGYEFQFFNQKNELITKSYSQAKIPPLHPEHETLNKAFQKKKRERRNYHQKLLIETYGRTGYLFTKGVKELYGQNSGSKFKKLLDLEIAYGRETIKKVLEQALKFQCFQAEGIINMLAKEPVQKPLPVKVNFPLSSTIKRDLKEYGDVLCKN